MKREELEAALVQIDKFVRKPDGPVIAAARERLAQLPEKCDHDNLDWQDPEKLLPPERCPDCHGKGVLYPPALVERIAKAIDVITIETWFDNKGIAVAVLDALNGETP